MRCSVRPGGIRPVARCVMTLTAASRVTSVVSTPDRVLTSRLCSWPVLEVDARQTRQEDPSESDHRPPGVELMYGSHSTAVPTQRDESANARCRNRHTTSNFSDGSGCLYRQYNSFLGRTPYLYIRLTRTTVFSKMYGFVTYSGRAPVRSSP